MPPRGRKPRTNPLIPTTNAPFAPSGVATAPAPMLLDAPICGTCWPGGWPEGGDYASCEHGEWSTTEHFVRRAAAELNGAAGNRHMAELAELAPAVIRGITTDGIPVAIELRGDQPALVSLTRIPLADVPDPAWSPLTSAPEPAPAVAVSPFRPKPAPEPEPVEVDPAELDTGEDVMFMPSGG